MNKQSEEILVSSFFKELEKEAALENAWRLIKNTAKLMDNVSVKSGLSYLSQHKGSTSTLAKGALNTPVRVPIYGQNVGKLDRFVSEELGNTANAFKYLGEGVSKDKNIVSNVGTVGKNFGRLLGDQVRGSMYKTVSPSSVYTDSTINVVSKTNQGPTIVKGKGIFKHKMFDRKIEGTTTSGDYIIKKRKGAIPFSMALTPPGFGLATLAIGSGKKDESPTSRVGNAVKETALWSVAAPVAQARLISDMLK